jgi:hypothetical protein
MEAEVRRLELSADRLRALTQRQRYVFALTGHIFNELMLLQKWIHVSRRPPGDDGPQEDAAVGISMFLLRVLAAKVYEALHPDALGKQSVSEVLRADYFDKVDGLTAKWDATLDRYKNLEWMGRVRNKGAFHYMNEAQWAPHLDDAFCEGGYVYCGKRYSDTFFHWAEMSASLPSFRELNSDDPFAGLSQMIEELGSVLVDLTDCLARGLQAFMKTSDVGGKLSDPIRFNAPAFEPPALHYFFADERLHANT